MSIYKAYQTKGFGKYPQLRYMKDKKFISKNNIPANILSQLVPGIEVSDDNLKLQAPLKSCIFCGEPTKTYRLINLQSLAVCSNHYLIKTVGQCIQQLRINQGEVNGSQTST